MNLYRWGQSAYETNVDLQQEKEGLASLGCNLSLGKEPPTNKETQGLIVTSKVPVDAGVMSSLPNLSFVLTTSQLLIMYSPD